MFRESWCPPCRTEVQRAYEQLEPEGLRLLGVSVRESPLDAAAYALYNVPTHIFIDATGSCGRSSSAT